MVFGLGRAELEVDDDPLLSVGHHTVGTTFGDVAVFISQDGTLVEKRPAVGEPTCHLRMGQPLAEHVRDLVEGVVVVVEDAVQFQLAEGGINVGRGADR